MLPDMVIKIGQWSVCLVFGTMCLYFVFGMGSSPVSVFWYLVFGMASSPVSGTKTSLGQWRFSILLHLAQFLHRAAFPLFCHFPIFAFFYSILYQLTFSAQLDNIHENISVVIDFIYKHDLLQVQRNQMLTLRQSGYPEFMAVDSSFICLHSAVQYAYYVCTVQSSGFQFRSLIQFRSLGWGVGDYGFDPLPFPHFSFHSC